MECPQCETSDSVTQTGQSVNAGTTLKHYTCDDCEYQFSTEVA